MDELPGGAGGTQRVLAGAMALSASNALWDSGELTQGQYVDAVLLGNGISSGLVPLAVGLRALMSLWMVGPVALMEIDGQPALAH